MRTESSGSIKPQLVNAKGIVSGVVLALCIALVACAPWRDRYFENGVDVLTQADVKGRLGKPHLVNDPLLSDEVTWTYRYAISESELDPSGIKSFGKQAGNLMGKANGGPREKVYCFKYILTFDKNGVLRHWERQICQIPKPPDPFQDGLSG